MKKLILGLGVLFAGYATTSLAALPTGVSSRCDVCVPSYCGGFTFGLTGLYWRPSSPQFEYGINFPNGASTDQGHHHYVDHNYNWGFKANIGYVFPCSGNDVNLTYTHWDHNEKDSARNTFNALPTFLEDFDFFDLIFPAAFTLASPITVTGTAVALTSLGVAAPVGFTAGPISELIIPIEVTDITEISANSDVENHTWDLDFGQTINVGCNFRLRFLAGLRYTRLEHNFKLRTTAVVNDQRAGFAFDVPATTTVGGVIVPIVGGSTLADLIPQLNVNAIVHDFVKVSSDFDGVGPRFGIDSSYHLGGGFGVVGSLSASLLVGETKNSFAERFDGTGTVTLLGGGALIDPIGSTIFLGETITAASPAFGTPIGIAFDPTLSVISFHHPDETRVVPNLDAKLALDWTYQFCNCSRSKVTIEAGYLVSHYFNALDREHDLAAFTSVAHHTRNTYDVSFDGPYISLQVAL